MQEVLKTVKQVAEKSLQVQIDTHALTQFSRKLIEDKIEPPPWNDAYHFHGDNQEKLAYFLVLDTINFCFWPPKGKPRWEIEYQSEKLSGYNALAVSLKHAIESGISLTRADFLATLSLDRLKQLLGGQGELQLLKQRLQNLNELGRVLLDEYHGDPCELIESAKRSAVALVRLVAEKFSSFRDVAEHNQEAVFFYKRAQLFAADLYGAFQGKEWGSFDDIDKLTAFADYKLPQVLRHLGILRYAQKLAHRVDRGVHIETGSPEEVEIRANTIWAVELIRQAINQTGKALRAFEIDCILWDFGQQDEYRQKPYHRTVSIFY